MKRLRWHFVALIVGVLALGVTGGTILAHSEGTDGDSTFQSFASRVAAILGLKESDVQDAFVQAGREMEDDALHRSLDMQVEKGRLTQEQADEYEGWYQVRPEALSPRLRFRGFGGHGFFVVRMRFGRGFYHEFGPTPTPETTDGDSA